MKNKSNAYFNSTTYPLNDFLGFNAWLSILPHKIDYMGIEKALLSQGRDINSII
uniref:Uncharacterized protein n=1 Tax=Oryza glaberrima TaxID=4538 RepID=I1NNH3_ORYGL